MNILGINVGLHDSSACLVLNGKLIAFGTEERFSRKKHDSNYPVKSIEFCLKKAKLDYDDIDYIANSWDYFSYESEKLFWHLEYLYKKKKKNPQDTLLYIEQLYKRKKKLYKQFNLPRKETHKLFKGKYINVKHHLSHAYSVFPLSGFKSSAVLIIDGSGELETVTIWHQVGNELTLVKEYKLPHSIGYFYGAITQFLGFMQHDEEWKVMGWAPYGEAKYIDELRLLIDTKKIKLNLDFFQVQNGKFPWYSSKLSKILNITPREKDSDFKQVYADIAASAQKLLEECFINLAIEAKKLTNEKNLCLAGGVTLNGKANGVLSEKKIFDNIFIQPAASDDGTALGAAFKIASDKGLKIINKLDNVYFGSSYSDSKVEETLLKYKLPFKKFKKFNQLSLFVANEITKSKVIGWFQGRSEFGPRALGNRSIIADPRNSKMKDIINKKIKYREAFRPFAPSILEEHSSNYFIGNKNNAFFMNQIFKVSKNKRKTIPAVTHVDNTARIQIVNKNINNKYYTLIKDFYKLTSVPLIINTSFNIKGEPNVETPEDAIKCFLKTGIDILIINNYMVLKEDIK